MYVVLMKRYCMLSVEEHPESLLMHSLWVPEWSLLMLGISGGPRSFNNNNTIDNINTDNTTTNNHDNDNTNNANNTDSNNDDNKNHTNDNNNHNTQNYNADNDNNANDNNRVPEEARSLQNQTCTPLKADHPERPTVALGRSLVRPLGILTNIVFRPVFAVSRSGRHRSRGVLICSQSLSLRLPVSSQCQRRFPGCPKYTFPET